MQLETADTRNRSRGGADFRRIIRKGRNIIAIECGGIGELVAGNLHAVARVAREAYDRLVEHFAPGFYWWNFRECRHSCPSLRTSMNSPVPRECGSIIRIDRKSTRLNSSHQIISYAVFCLKKKKYKNSI